MKSFLMAWVVKPVAILVAGSVAGLVAGVLPCYLFPAFGADVRDWCGHKSEPPHFVLQFWAGFLVAAVTAAYFCYFRKR